MLKALYDYAILHDLVLPEGYVKKTVKAYISLDSKGNFVDIFLGDNMEEIPCPDIGSLANGKDKCNVLVEKSSIVISPPESEMEKDKNIEKRLFFMNALIDGSAYVSELGICANALQNNEILDKIRKGLKDNKIKEGDRISFRVSGKSILENPKVEEWWKIFRARFKNTKKENTSLCFIKGEEVIPVETTTPINGLHVVGGHARGDALICFDKPAFCSYGLKKAQNASVSENAFAAVKLALDELIKKAPIEAGAKFLHWYDYEVSRKEDLILQILNPKDEDEEFVEDFDTGNEEERVDKVERESIERAENQNANELIQSLKKGNVVARMNCNYYILILSGVSGRVMIRRFERGNYQKLQDSIMQWNADLELVNLKGEQNILSCEFKSRLLALLKYQKDDREPWKRIDKELSGITSALIMAIINNTVLPDMVVVRALANIRSYLNNSSEENKGRVYERIFQWVKVWILRHDRERYGGKLVSKYNMEINESAYHCGGLLAVYDWIQRKAMNDVNTGVVQRYYASAVRSPALVLGQLSKLSNYHLDKIEHNGYLKKYLEELYCAIGNEIPKTLNLEKQALFALGYYQMGAKMREEATSNKKELENKKIKERGE